MTSQDPEYFSAVLAAAKAGEPAAFEQLYRALSPRLAGFARARRTADPDGLVNEVFLAVFRNIQSFSGEEPSFNAWVFQIARNKIIDAHRRGERRPDEVTIGSSIDLENSFARHMVDEAVDGDNDIERHLALLTPDQRDVVTLRIVGQLSLAEVAAVLDKPVGAVKSLQLRAFRTIARHLAAQGVSR